MASPEPTPKQSLRAAAGRPGKTFGDFPGAGRAWWTVAVLLALYVLSYLDRQILVLMIDDVRETLGINDFQISLLQGLTFAIFYTVFGLPFGWAADRYARRGIIFFGVTVWSIAAAACGLAQNYISLLLARIGVGVGEAALSPAAFSLLSDTFPPHRLAFAISVFAAGSVLGSSAALAAGGLIIGLLPAGGFELPVVGHLAGWQMVFLLTGLPCLLVGWLIFTVVEPARKGRLTGPAPRFADAFKFLTDQWRFFTPHFVGFGLMSLCGYGLLVWAPSYMHRVFGWPMSAVGLALALAMGVSGVLGAAAMGLIVDRWFRAGRTDAHLRLFVGVALTQPVLVLCGVWSGNPWVFLGFVAANLAIASFTGVSAAALQIVTPNEYRGQISSAYLLVFNLLGIGLGPSVVAALTAYLFRDDLMVGWSIVLTFVVIMPVAALCFALGMKPMRAAVARIRAPDGR